MAAAKQFYFSSGYAELPGPSFGASVMQEDFNLDALGDFVIHDNDILWRH
ncbi:MAG: hypothetical protein ABSG69_11675 [Candidatus Acidiferrum sp.]